MKCPHCHRSIFISTPAPEKSFDERIIQTLAYVNQCNAPLFGGLIQRNVVQQDPEITYMLANDLIMAIEDKGFVLTDKGRALIAAA